MKLRGAMLFVKDLHRMKRFYGEILGVEPENRGAEEWAVFDSGGIQFCLHAIPTALAQEIDIATPPELREEVAVKLMFEVNDLEAERERLESFGARIILRPWQNPAQAFDAVDPEGNIFQIFASGLSL